MNDAEFLEQAWEDLLSQDHTRIRNRFATLDADSQAVVLEHFKKMISESGWHPVQVQSATAALLALQPPEMNL